VSFQSDINTLMSFENAAEEAQARVLVMICLPTYLALQNLHVCCHLKNDNYNIPALAKAGLSRRW